MVRIESNIDEVNKTLDILSLFFADKFLDKLAFALERRVKQKITEYHLVDKGRFRSSIRGRRTGIYSFIVSDGVTYGIYHEIGTGIFGPKARFIVPKTKKSLRWEAQSYLRSPSGRVKRITKEIFAKKVKGVKAKRPFLNALMEFEQELDKQIKSSLRNILK